VGGGGGGGGGEDVVAASAGAAGGHAHFLPAPGGAGQAVAGVAVHDRGAGRHGDEEIAAVASVAFAAPAAAALRRPPVFAVDDLGQAVGAGHGADDDIAAVPAVAAVRPSLGDVLLPPEADAAS